MSSHSNNFHSQLGRAGTLAVVVSASLMFTGCDSGGGPGASTSASASATPTSRATPTPSPTIAAVYKPADASGPAQYVPVPVLPDVAKTETKEGLEAFTRYWFELLSYGYETGDTRTLERVSSASCVFCTSLRGGIAESWDSGRWISGGRITTPAVAVTFDSATNSYALVQVIQEEIQIRTAEGSLFQDPVAATNTGSRAAATYEDAGWTMSDLGLIR